MKLRALFLKSLFMAVSLGLTGSLLAQSTSGPTSGQKLPDVAKKPAKIPGLVFPRANGGFLGLEIDGDSNFKLSFYGADKKPIAPDVAIATIIWYFNSTLKQKLVYALSPGADGKSLTLARAVTPPLPPKATLLLYSSASSSEPSESYLNIDLTSPAVKE